MHALQKGAVDRMIQDAEDRLAQARQYNLEVRNLGAKFMKQGDGPQGQIERGGGGGL